MSGFRIGRLFGFEVRLDWSILVIFALIAANLGAGLFPQWHPDWSFAVTWSTALAAAALFLVSILVHELSHALAARSTGTEVTSITLFLFGGVSRMRGEPRSAGAEFFIAVVGPLTSLAIGIVASLLVLALTGRGLGRTMDAEAVTWMMRDAGPLATLLAWLGPTNVALAFFNLLPGFPLDGGRVLRSVFWAATKDFARATRWAGIVGQLFAGLLFALGAVQLLSGMIGNGLWLMLIGWFLGSAARQSMVQVLVKEVLAGVPVSRVMTPRERVMALRPDQSAELALQLMAQYGLQELPVLEGDRFIGMVRRDELVRWFSQQPRGGEQPPRPLTPMLHH